MSANFPLYDAMVAQIACAIDLTDEERAQLSKDLRAFGKEPAERAYGLIRAHSINSGEQSPVGLPYAGKQMKTGPKFDLAEVPPELQKILRHFVALHQEVNA